MSVGKQGSIKSLLPECRSQHDPTVAFPSFPTAPFIAFTNPSHHKPPFPLYLQEPVFTIHLGDSLPKLIAIKINKIFIAVGKYTIA